MLSRRNLLGGVIGVVAGWLGREKAQAGVPIKMELRESEAIAAVGATLKQRVISRKDPDGLTPISWEEQKPGDKILSCDWDNGKIVRMHVYRVVRHLAESEWPASIPRIPENAVVEHETLTWNEFWASYEQSGFADATPENQQAVLDAVKSILSRSKNFKASFNASMLWKPKPGGWMQATPTGSEYVMIQVERDTERFPYDG